jgi:Ca-activated chloride channel family protein
VSERESSNSIDARLRDVALPAGMLARLREIATLSDAELDRQISAVRVPDGVLDRLRQIGTLSDADIDVELRDVELPRDMQNRIARSMRWPGRQAQWIGWAVAASLLAIVSSVVYFAGNEQGVAPQPNNSALGTVASGTNPNVRQSHPQEPTLPVRINAIAEEKRPANEPENWQVAPPHPERTTQLAKQPIVATSDDVAAEQSPADSVSDDAVAEPVRAVEPAPVQHSIFGGMTAPVPPDLKLVSTPLPRGLMGPRVEGYDLVSELRWGRHPLVVPSRPRLRESRVPVWTDTSSFDAASEMLAKGHLPRPAEIHTEDFLAAMDYGFPLPDAGPIGIRTAAGPAPRGPAGMSLLQVGIQAAKLSKQSTNETHLMLVVDASAGIRDSARWDMIRRAILQLVPELGPHDRVSIVAFNSTAEVLADRVDSSTLRQIVSSWNDTTWKGAGAGQAIRLDSVADVATGIEPALAGMGSPVSSSPKMKGPAAVEKIVLIANSLEPIDDRSMPRLRDLLRQAVGGGAKWEMIGLTQDDAFSSQWNELAAIGGHAPRHAGTPDGLFQRLNEIVAGRSQVVAADVQMKVVFDPAAVRRYRLIGHELNAGDGFSLAPMEADLRSAQAATALYEVELKPDGPAEVAYVEVSWRDPVSETPRRLRQPIGRLQFVSSWRECALPLQAAVLAAATADVLRSNAPANTAKTLDQIAELAAEMNPALADRPAIVRLKQMIDRMRSTRSVRPDAAAGPT